ncbi:coenzyme F420-0:L-glutamate ligase [Candidatus Nitrosocosmicus agrestis]|uniref:coenzyme F420-0:L-glutamate ligase n=1 Tax=Candidatus Nitrosocosmicus agrestis TaxID=2563600 RepID=UPI001917576B|nr:coenzyme F420-0:L-glutamate ligase [Candidatus Nitrosocosmicus sp. SS]MDR4491132.1 coenzyme F420-0:L-glutamate ligase [Candidatus Nitrosocosmicus sp.]
MITIIPIHIDVQIQPGQNLADIIFKYVKKAGQDFIENDIIVVAQKIVSKSENRIVHLETVVPSQSAIDISKIHSKDPRLIQLILNESNKIVKLTRKHLIVQTKHGFICANAGIDQSNVSEDASEVLLLPKEPDESAKIIQKSLLELSSKKVSVIISDTFGRPFRIGQTNVAIGVAGIPALRSYIGTNDAFGKELKVTEIAIADEIASAAELVMGKVSGIPVAILRGYNYKSCVSDDYSKVSITQIIRRESDDLFLKYEQGVIGKP